MTADDELADEALGAAQSAPLQSASAAVGLSGHAVKKGEATTSSLVSSVEIFVLGCETMRRMMGATYE